MYWFGGLPFANLLSLSEIYTGKVVAGANKNSYRKFLIIEITLRDHIVRTLAV
jgi:hypothetical protein